MTGHDRGGNAERGTDHRASGRRSIIGLAIIIIPFAIVAIAVPVSRLFDEDTKKQPQAQTGSAGVDAEHHENQSALNVEAVVVVIALFAIVAGCIAIPILMGRRRRRAGSDPGPGQRFAPP